MRVTFGSSGQVSEATMSQSVGSGVLDNSTIQYVKANWSGTPNTSVTVPITYKLD